MSPLNTVLAPVCLSAGAKVINSMAGAINPSKSCADVFVRPSVCSMPIDTECQSRVWNLSTLARFF